MKYTIDDLRTMSLNRLRNVDIATVAEEKLVQSVIDEKMLAMPVIGAPLVFSHAVTDSIKTPEQEKELQAKIDAHNEEARKKLLGESLEEQLVQEPVTETLEVPVKVKVKKAK